MGRIQLKRIPPVMVRPQPPLTPIRASPEEIAKGFERARRIAKGTK